MTTDRWTAVQAFAEMKTFKFGPEYFDSVFKKFVLAFRIDPLNTPGEVVAPPKTGS